MVVEYIKPASMGEGQVFEKEQLDNDLVSTFQTKRSPLTEIATSQAKKVKTSDAGSRV